jgi:hypothetical protein
MRRSLTCLLGGAIILSGCAGGGRALDETGSGEALDPPSAPTTTTRVALTDGKLGPGGKLIPGAPLAMTLREYRYQNLDVHRRYLAREGHVRDSTLVERLAKEFNALIAPSKAPTAYSCPSDKGSEMVVVARYPQHGTIVLKVQLSGCAVVSSASGIRLIPGKSNLTAELRGLVHTPKRSRAIG